MRCIASPVAIVAASWLTTRTDSFIVTPSRTSGSQSPPVARAASSSSLSLHQPNRQTAARTAFSVGVAHTSPRWRRRSATEMSTDDQEDGTKGELTANSMDGADPEELLRQMSIPDLAQNLDKAEGIYGAVHPQVASALIPLSQALYANGDMAPARETCTRALKILQASYGAKPTVEMAECLHTLAMIQQSENPQIGDKALGSQNMALELAMRVCGPDSIEVAAYARCLAQMSEDYAKFLAPGLPRPFYMPNPVPLYRQTINILEKVVGPDHPEVASALDDLASALLFWRDDDFSDAKAFTMLPEAERLAARSLAISKSMLGADNPITAGREHNLGMVLRGLGREDEARDHFRWALAIRQKVLGVDHPDTKTSRDLVEGKDVTPAEA